MGWVLVKKSVCGQQYYLQRMMSDPSPNDGAGTTIISFWAEIMTRMSRVPTQLSSRISLSTRGEALFAIVHFRVRNAFGLTEIV
jgi:hypothetical protein